MGRRSDPKRLVDLGNSGGTTPTVAAGYPVVISSLTIENDQAATTYVQLFNKATAGAVTPGTTVPDQEYRVPASTHRDVRLPADGLTFDVGLVIFASTQRGGGTGSAAGVNASAAIGSR